MSTDFQRLIYDTVTEVDTLDLDQAEKVERLKDAMLDVFDIFADLATREQPDPGLYSQGRHEGQEDLARRVLEAIKSEVTK